MAAGGTTGFLDKTEAYDDTKVAAIINEIDGKTSTGVSGVTMPALFGMNFQAVSVGVGTPGTLLKGALEHTDASIGKMLDELAKQGKLNTTLVVISAKHGQAPINRALRRGVSDAAVGTALQNNLGNGFIQTDDLALIWMQDRSPANEASALANLQPLAVSEGFDQGTIYTQGNLPPFWDNFSDPRIPDFAIRVNLGVIYTGGSKIAEHGGFSDDDEHVALLLSYPGQRERTVSRSAQTAQVAPTILKALGINGHQMQAVQQEGTQDLEVAL